MKIFNWVHRKFHNTKEDKNAEFVVKETESQVPLENVTLLTIGTFGFHHLSDYADKFENPVDIDKLFGHYQKQLEGKCHEEEEEEEEKEYFSDLCDEEKEEVNPLVYTTFRSVSNYDEINDDDVITSSEEDDDKARKTSKGRTTLAELLSADSNDPMFTSLKAGDPKKHGHDEVCSKKPHHDHSTVKGLSFAKKLIPKVGKQDTPSIKKFHRMMKKLLKKKIHPDLEGKLQKKENQITTMPAMCGLLDDHERYGLVNESASVLQI